jgi:hypothetical protein
VFFGVVCLVDEPHGAEDTQNAFEHCFNVPSAVRAATWVARTHIRKAAVYSHYGQAHLFAV